MCLGGTGFSLYLSLPVLYCILFLFFVDLWSSSLLLYLLYLSLLFSVV